MVIISYYHHAVIFSQTWKKSLSFNPSIALFSDIRVIRTTFIRLKELFNNFEYITFSSCPNERNKFWWKVHLDKTTLTRNKWEKCCSKSVPVIYMIYITVLDRTDFEQPIGWAKKTSFFQKFVIFLFFVLQLQQRYILQFLLVVFLDNLPAFLFDHSLQSCRNWANQFLT